MTRQDANFAVSRRGREFQAGTGKNEPVDVGDFGMDL
jgi:hypothetical protein